MGDERIEIIAGAKSSAAHSPDTKALYFMIRVG